MLQFLKTDMQTVNSTISNCPILLATAAGKCRRAIICLQDKKGKEEEFKFFIVIYLNSMKQL